MRIVFTNGSSFHSSILPKEWPSQKPPSQTGLSFFIKKWKSAENRKTFEQFLGA